MHPPFGPALKPGGERHSRLVGLGRGVEGSHGPRCHSASDRLGGTSSGASAKEGAVVGGVPSPRFVHILVGTVDRQSEAGRLTGGGLMAHTAPWQQRDSMSALSFRGLGEG